MNIFFNTYSMAFQCPGGGEIQLLKSKEALERRGHKVTLFDQWRHCLDDADVVHQFAVQGGSYNLCAYANAKNIPLVLSPILWLDKTIDSYPINEIGHMMRLADVICPNSNSEIQRFASFFEFPVEKYHVTHNGVDDCFFEKINPDKFRERYGIRQQFILCVANIEERKNQHALLAAANSINMFTVLIGNVRDEGYFSRISESYAGRFQYIDYLEHGSELLRSAYAACSAFVLPSLLETPGLAALEAAAVGRPLVITNVGCTQEYFGDGAFYVDPNVTEDISQKIVMAMLHSRESVDDLQARVKGFNWDSVAEELEFAYAKAIACKGMVR